MTLAELRRGRFFTVQGAPWLIGKLIDKTAGAAVVEYYGRRDPVTVSLGTVVDLGATFPPPGSRQGVRGAADA